MINWEVREKMEKEKKMPYQKMLEEYVYDR